MFAIVNLLANSKNQTTILTNLLFKSNFTKNNLHAFTTIFKL